MSNMLGDLHDSAKSLKKRLGFIQALINLALSIYDFDVCLYQEQNQSKLFVYIVKLSLHRQCYVTTYMWIYSNKCGIPLWD